MVGLANKKADAIPGDEHEEVFSLDLIPDPPSHIFQKRRRPGPPSAEALSGPERDLADAALLLELIDSGTLRTDSPDAELPPMDNWVGRSQNRLSADDEAELARRVQIWGDVDARNTLVLANIGLVHLVANQFCRPPLRYDDLLQEGTIGLIRATETFEPSRNIRFSTYSVYWIRAKIQRLIQRLEKDDVPSISGADAITDTSGKSYRPRARKLSLDRSAEDEEGRTLGEMLPSEIENPEGLALRREKLRVIKEVLRDIVEELGDPRLNEIIAARLLADEPETLTSVGEKLNLSREGARLLESKMLKLARERLAQWHHSG